MGKYDYQQSTRIEQIVFFPKLRAIVPKKNLQKSHKTQAPKQKKKKKRRNTENRNIFCRFKRQLQHHLIQGHSLGSSVSAAED